MLKLQTQGNTLGQRGIPGFWGTWMSSSGDPWYKTSAINYISPMQVGKTHKTQLSKPQDIFFPELHSY